MVVVAAMVIMVMVVAASSSAADDDGDGVGGRGQTERQGEDSRQQGSPNEFLHGEKVSPPPRGATGAAPFDPHTSGPGASGHDYCQSPGVSPKVVVYP